jgi:hypothetical protein
MRRSDLISGNGKTDLDERGVRVMSNVSPRDADPNKEIMIPRPRHWILATLILLLVFSYTIALVIGAIKSADKIDAVDLGLIALGALLIVALINPQVLQRIRIFELGSLKFELREVRIEQDAQKDALDGIRTVLSILLPKAEQDHLIYLLNNKATDYKGGYAMRTELRHLRSLGLIETCRDEDGRYRVIEDMRSNMHFDLSDWVTLTDLGKKSAKWISDARAAAEERSKEKEAMQG